MPSLRETASRISRSHVIKPRALAFDLDQKLPRWWANGDAYATLLLTVMSVGFPEGERIFMESVRAYRSSIRSPQLLEQIRCFIKQEGLHSRNHSLMNSWPDAPVDVKALEKRFTAVIRAQADRANPLQNLANTCALEHLTSVMGYALLTYDDGNFLASFAEPFQSLWRWHALEEVDHKAVAFDVFEEVSGDYGVRVRTMMVMTLRFIVGMAFVHALTIVESGEWRRPRTLAKSWWRMWKPGGIFPSMISDYLQYYRRDFHPWLRDDRALIGRASAELAQRLARAA